MKNLGFKWNLTLVLFTWIALFSLPAYAQTNSTSSNRQHPGAGEQIFLQRCFACHSTIQDQVRSGPSLYGEMRKSPHKKTAEIKTIVLNGKGRMPPFKERLTAQDLDDLIAYIRSL